MKDVEIFEERSPPILSQNRVAFVLHMMLGSENRHSKLWMSSHHLRRCTLDSFLRLLPSR